MSAHEFAATINTFNIAAWHYPPPSPISGAMYFYLLCLSTLLVTTIFVAIHHTHQMGLMLALPFSFLIISMTIIYYRRKQREKVIDIYTSD